MDFINCKSCARPIPEDSFECPFCESDTGLYNDDDYQDRLNDETEHTFGTGDDKLTFKNFSDFLESTIGVDWNKHSGKSSLGNFLNYSNTEHDIENDKVKNAFLSYDGDPKEPLYKKICYNFNTEIIAISKQSGGKYKPLTNKNKIWSIPMLEITTRHGIYITYSESSWIFKNFKNREVSVWSEKSSRKGWLWLHEAHNHNFFNEDDLICSGCCNLKTVDSYEVPF